MDSIGNILWSKKRYTNDLIRYIQMFSFTETPDMGYLYTGILSLPSLGAQIFYSQTDSANNVKWARYFGNNEYNNLGTNVGFKAIVSNNNKYIFSSNEDGISIVKLDDSGFGFCNFNSLNFITEDIIIGINDIPVTTNNISFLFENRNFTFDDVSDNSVLYCSDVSAVNKIENESSIKIYPNPFYDVVNFEYNALIKAIRIYNLLGQEVYYKEVGGKQKVQLYRNDLVAGIFVYRVMTDDGNIFTGKLVVE